MRSDNLIKNNNNVTYKDYLILTFPLVLTSLTIPLLGAVDTALIGHLNNANYLAGVAISVVIFSTLYWLFGFLRVATTGFIVQTLGHPLKLHQELWRPLILALFLGITFILLQQPIFEIAMTFYQPTALVRESAYHYYHILIWGAPLTLVNYVLLGYLIGRTKTKIILSIQVIVNLINLVFVFTFVLYFNFEVKGAACATLLSLICSLLLSINAVKQDLPKVPIKNIITGLFSWQVVRKLSLVNGDLIIRTICLLWVTNSFIASGSHLGTNILAANSILFQIHYVMAYIYDGFANSASVYSGRAQGEHNLNLYKKVLSFALLSCVGVSLILTLIWAGLDSVIITLFTRQPELIALCHEYGFWLLFFPVIGCAGIVYYGIFTGSTNTTPVRNSMLLALITWYIGWYYFIPRYHNQGLWFTYILYCAARSFFLMIYIPSAKKQVTCEPNPKAKRHW